MIPGGIRRGRGGGLFLALGCALYSAGSLPCVEFRGVAGVEVGKHGVEFLDVFGGLGEDLADAGGVFYTALGFGLVVGVGIGDGVAVGAEVFYEVGGE